MVDPFASAYRSADRYAKVRNAAVRLEAGDAWAYGTFGGMALFVFGFTSAVFLNGEGSSGRLTVWPTFVLFFSILVLVLSFASVFAVPAVGLVERLFLPWSVRRLRIDQDSLPVSAVVRAVEALSPRGPSFPGAHYGSRVNITTVAAKKVVAAVDDATGGARLLAMIRSLNVAGELSASSDVSVADASETLSTLDEPRFSLLLALIYLESERSRSEFGYRILQVGLPMLGLASELQRMFDHQVDFCLDVIQSSRWDGSAGDLLDTARRVST